MVVAWILLASNDGEGERNMVVAVTGNGGFGSGDFGKEKREEVMRWKTRREMVGCGDFNFLSAILVSINEFC